MISVIIILAFSYHLTNGLQSHSLPQTCEQITYRICRKTLPYNATHFPNLLNHRSQAHAVREIQRYKKMMPDANCSKHAVFLLCSYFFPICLPEIPGPFKPCRSLCLNVKEDCAARFPFWPSFMSCDDLPEFKSHMCIQPESFVEPETTANNSCQQRPPMDYKTYMSRRCDYVIRLKVISLETFEHHGTVIHGRAAKIFKHGNVTIHKGRVNIFTDSNETCPEMQSGRVFLVCGHEDAVAGKLQLSSTSLVEAWSEESSRKIRRWHKMERKNRKGKQMLGVSNM